MKRLLPVLLLFIVMFTGCMAFETVHLVPQIPQHINSSSGIIGQEREAWTGNAMLIEEDLYFYDGLVATADYQPPHPSMMIYPLIPKGTQFKLYGKLNNGNLVYQALELKPKIYTGTYSQWKYCIITTPSGEAYADTACSITYERKWATSPPTNFLKKDKVLTKGSFKKELVYNGKSGDTIKLSYREYNKDLARPAFYQDLTYDLSESATIRFQNMKIEILKATNSSIKFIVLSSMSPAN